MTNQQHPITPPPELVQQWVQEVYGLEGVPGSAPGKLPLHIATQAARWGANQELEACCEWITERRLWKWASHDLRAARRPKPPSLKEQALKALEDDPKEGAMIMIDMDQFAIIRRALEQLDD